MKSCTLNNVFVIRPSHVSRDVDILSLQTQFVWVVSSEDTIWYLSDFDPCCCLETYI